ncbi:histidine kinase [Chlorella sorokiniana]|uniref:Histidine kinase n=1 Tax=Chlorella sorokiniana TaxID=3076 RepID=A0A2P6U2Y2_CHLSO|nr:histidine kinase [Chlorella sorokiniana]|eukprot:PRW60669.1 histidine kinase [Chlorella sorokiniana]
MTSESRPPLPPFTLETARQKVQAAQDAWNTKDPDRVALAYTEDTEWRNRAEFVKGREAVRQFLRRKWEREQGYVLRKYLFAYQDNRISVCFEYEYHDAAGQWYRAYGNENWEFNEQGLMRKRIASINEAPIRAEERRIAVPEGKQVTYNSWLAEQGVGGDELPLRGGNQPAY